MAEGSVTDDCPKDILHEIFVLLSSGKEQDVKLFASSIQYTPTGAAKTKAKDILLQDIIGVQCMKGKVVTDQRAYLTIYLYPRGRTITGSVDARRSRLVIVFVVGSSVVFTENLQKACLWREAILALLRPISKCSIKFVFDLNCRARRHLSSRGLHWFER